MFDGKMLSSSHVTMTVVGSDSFRRAPTIFVTGPKSAGLFIGVHNIEASGSKRGYAVLVRRLTLGSVRYILSGGFVCSFRARRTLSRVGLLMRVGVVVSDTTSRGDDVNDISLTRVIHRRRRTWSTCPRCDDRNQVRRAGLATRAEAPQELRCMISQTRCSRPR